MTMYDHIKIPDQCKNLIKSNIIYVSATEFVIELSCGVFLVLSWQITINIIGSICSDNRISKIGFRHGASSLELFVYLGYIISYIIICIIYQILVILICKFLSRQIFWVPMKLTG